MNAPPVQYVETSDGASIAFSVSGEGRTLVLPPFVHSHVQLDWLNDLTISRRARFLRSLAQNFRVVTFDNRGQGLSSRGLPDSLALADFDLDMEAVASKIEERTFVFVAIARASHLAVRYIMKHPERVSALVLITAQRSMNDSTFAGSAPPTAVFDLLPAQNWTFFHQTQAMPGLSAEEIQSAMDMLGQTANPEDYRLTMNTWRESDISDLLPKLRLPTLVLHARDFPFLKSEEATRIAALIPNSRLTMIDGYSIAGDSDQAARLIEDFLSGLAPDNTAALAPLTTGPPDDLSSRELEVLRLLGQGKSNPEIARALFISRNTVQNHVSSILIKTNLQNRAQAAVYAKEHGIV